MNTHYEITARNAAGCTGREYAASLKEAAQLRAWLRANGYTVLGTRAVRS
jgi:hypothetical protein